MKCKAQLVSLPAYVLSINLKLYSTLIFHDSCINHGNYRFSIPNTNQPTETMIEAFTRLDSEILAIENLAPGARLTTSEAWMQHLESIHLKVDDISGDKPSMDVISELEEELTLDEEKLPSSAIDRDTNDIVKVKNVCTCSF